MSPLFHGHEHLPSLAELGPQLDEVVKGLAAQPVEQLAAALMTKYFTTDWLVASQITDMVAVDTICWDLVPDNSGERAGEAIPDAFFSLQDIVTEALQLLQTAGLMERSYKVNQDHTYSQWLTGHVTTRRGRAALSNGTVAQSLATPRSAASTP